MNRKAPASAALAPLKGAPASLLLALILAERPLGDLELAARTGFSPRSIKRALAQLRSAGLVLFDDSRQGWLLDQQAALAAELRQALLSEMEEESLRLVGVMNEVISHLAELTAVLKEYIYAPGASGRPGQPGIKALPAGPRPPTLITPGRGSTVSGRKLDADAAGAEKMAPNGEIISTKRAKTTAKTAKTTAQKGQTAPPVPALLSSSASPASSTALNPPVSGGNEAAAGRKGDGKKGDENFLAALDKNGREIAAWLQKAGIGRKSPKMKLLLSLNLDLPFVKAHVLEHLAWREGLVEGERPLTSGLLIRKLEDGDLAPALRCEKCLRLPSRSGFCGCLPFG